MALTEKVVAGMMTLQPDPTDPNSTYRDDPRDLGSGDDAAHVGIKCEGGPIQPPGSVFAIQSTPQHVSFPSVRIAQASQSGKSPVRR